MQELKARDLELVSVIQVRNHAEGKTKKSYGTFLPFCELIYHRFGENRVVFDDTVIEARAGKVIFLPCGKHHTYDAEFLESGECIDLYFTAKEPLFPIAHTWDAKENKTLQALFSKLYSVWERKEIGYYNRAMALVYSILAELQALDTSYLPKNSGDRLNAAIDYIHLHFTDRDFSYEQLPALCHLGYTYFKKLFVKRFGVVPSAYVRHLRIQRACELLMTKRFSVAEVAQQCGFSDVYYFSRVFKQSLGVAPSQWEK